MKRPALFVELCAGTAALSLALHGGPHARPPVSRMGSKRGYARAILAILGLRRGQGADHYLWCEPDPGCRLLLEAYRDQWLANRRPAPGMPQRLGECIPCRVNGRGRVPAVGYVWVRQTKMQACMKCRGTAP